MVVSTQCAHKSRHRLPPAGCASSPTSGCREPQSFPTKRETSGLGAVAACRCSHSRISLVEHVGEWLFLALASVLLIRKHLLIIAGSFSLVLFKVQIALLCFLVMKLIDTHGENSNNADKCKVGSTLSHPPETALLALPCISFGRASHLNVECLSSFPSI